MQGPNARPDGIAFTIHGRDELDLIEPLWEGLAAHHRERAQANAPAFLDEMEAKTFAARRDELLEKNRDRALRVELAFDPAAGGPVGYCVASGASGGAGEVESIFVDDAYRSRGIGGALLEHAAAWMDELGTVEQALFVFAGNDRALPFYARHGFSPRFMVLVRRPRG
ncbi:MAG TPA: GNAT family N-acetyltransferase [Methanoregulaceae archaeon]|nr:GNAT family N-acetyltransferase [Methanoregulaceae archaeon]